MGPYYGLEFVLPGTEEIAQWLRVLVGLPETPPDGLLKHHPSKKPAAYLGQYS